jgi:hypothetical protein
LDIEEKEPEEDEKAKKMVPLVKNFIDDKNG